MSQRNQPSARSWQRISIALMGALLAASLVYGVLSSQPPHYQSRAILFANNAGLAVDWPRLLDTYTHLLRTPATLQAALDTAQSPLSADALSSAMSLESLPNTQLIALNVSSTIATQPQALADALAQQLIAENARLTDTPDVLALKKQLTDLQTQLDATHAESQTLDTQCAATRIAGTAHRERSQPCNFDRNLTFVGKRHGCGADRWRIRRWCQHIDRRAG